MLLLPELVRTISLSIWAENSQSEEASLPLPGVQMVESQWRALYKAAILELDPEQLQARSKAAEDAIRERISGERVPHNERVAMEEALLTLSILKRKKF